MQFGDSFLPESGWTLTNATMNAGSLVISAGGSASITLTEVENTNLLPEALRVLLTASSYTPTYAPTSFARIHIEYEDDNTYDAILPIVNNFNGFMSILWPSISNYEGINVGAFTSLTFSIFSSTGITLSSWSLAKSLNDYLKTDTLYHGIRITTENGFEAIRSDGASEARLNSEVFTMRAKDDQGVMKDRLYFDPIKGNYVFDGLLSATMIEALEAEFDVTVSNVTITNVLAAETGYIAQLTVDQLDTSTKVQRYLNHDTSDVNYIKIHSQHIEFITASTDGGSTEQALDRQGNALYWKDDSHDVVTLNESDYPVLMYKYEEVIKAKISFDNVGGIYTPRITLGAGDGVTDKSAKAEIYKGQTGLEVNYYKSNTGDQLQLILSDEGIIQTGNTGAVGIRNIAISAEPPASPQMNDLWIDTSVEGE